MIKKIVQIFIFCLFSGQAISGIPIPKNGCHPWVKEIKYASCDLDFYQLGHDKSGKVYSEAYEDAAIKSFVYALMASNAYSSNPAFMIPGWKRVPELETNTWRGMGLTVYESKSEKKLVLAFEGTNPYSLRDWVFGNLNIFWKGQYGEVEEEIENIPEKYMDYKIIATGHSLGGGLALHTSLYKDNVDAYAFNSSPRVYSNTDMEIKENSNRFLISEKEEILESIRNTWPALKEIAINDNFSHFDFLEDIRVKEHAMYYMARGLTIVAASAGNVEAIEIMKINLGCNFDNSSHIWMEPTQKQRAYCDCNQNSCVSRD